MRKNILTMLAAATLSLVLVSCQDTQTLQQNEQLKSQVVQLQKENGELGKRVETLTAERDELTQTNIALRERASRKTKHTSKKTSSQKKRSHGRTVAEGPTPRAPVSSF
jgi:cell division protein FtsB